MGQNGFDRACVSVVFLFLLCFIAHSYEANGGTDMEVLACFRPGFFKTSDLTYVAPENEDSLFSVMSRKLTSHQMQLLPRKKRHYATRSLG